MDRLWGTYQRTTAKTYNDNFSRLKKGVSVYYGLTADTDLREMVEQVCKCLGTGVNGVAVELLLETAGAETLRGELEDPTKYAGMGLTQFDKMPFQDVKDRCRFEDKVRINDYFGIDIELVEWEHLRYSPLLALIFTRLKYKKIPAFIPNTFKGRAEYWKEHYNTEAGKGTIEHYMYNNMKYQ